MKKFQVVELNQTKNDQIKQIVYFSSLAKLIPIIVFSIGIVVVFGSATLILIESIVLIKMLRKNKESINSNKDLKLSAKF